MKNFEEEIKLAICEQLGVKMSEVTNEKNFSEDLNADSMDMVALLMVIEEKLQFTIKDEDAENMTTVQDVINYVNLHVQHKN